MLDKKPEVWASPGQSTCPLTAMIRNLATLTRVGVIAPMKIRMGLRAAERHWQCPLTEDFTRIHPINGSVGPS